MSTRVDGKQRSEILKGMREAHAESFSRTQELLKAQKGVQQKILGALKEAPHSVPEVAEATELRTSEVLWWLSSLKKYGKVAEDGMQGDYPMYRLVEEK